MEWWLIVNDTCFSLHVFFLMGFFSLQGVCEKQKNHIVQRLFSIIDTITVDQFGKLSWKLF